MPGLKKISNRFYISSAFFLLLCWASACKQENDQEPKSFTWNYDGISYNARLDTAYANIAFGPLILASAGNSLFTPAAELQIGVSSFNTGTYTFTIGGNRINFTDPLGFSYASNSGSLTITNNNNNFISGNFSANLNSGKNITGSFVNTPIKP